MEHLSLNSRGMAMVKTSIYAIMLCIATLSLAHAGCKDSSGVLSSDKDIMKLAQRVNDDTNRMNPTVVFMSDFGDTEAVAICHQMKKRIDSSLEIIDFNHNVNTFNIDHASILLERSRDFVNGTVFMAVVDPGVGTHRRPLILKTKRTRVQKS